MLLGQWWIHHWPWSRESWVILYNLSGLIADVIAVLERALGYNPLGLRHQVGVLTNVLVAFVYFVLRV